MKNDGVEFQNFVAMLERVLQDNSDAIVESPKRLRDKDTGKLREHDVVVTWKLRHHTILTAIECRDLSRKITVNAVEGFAKKCEKTGIHHGVVVSAKGFYESAITKAEALDISLMTLQGATAFDWMEPNFVVEFTAIWGPLTEIAIFTSDGYLGGQMKLFDCTDLLITEPMLHDLLIKHAPKPEVQRDKDTDEVFPVIHEFKTLGWWAQQDGHRYGVERIVLHSSFTVERKLLHSDSHSYAGRTDAYEVVSTKLDIAGDDRKLLVVKGAHGFKIALSAEPDVTLGEDGNVPSFSAAAADN